MIGSRLGGGEKGAIPIDRKSRKSRKKTPPFDHLHVVLIEDEEDLSVFWPCLFERTAFLDDGRQVWRGDTPCIAPDAIDIARAERKRRQSISSSMKR